MCSRSLPSQARSARRSFMKLSCSSSSFLISSRTARYCRMRVSKSMCHLSGLRFTLECSFLSGIAVRFTYLHFLRSSSDQHAPRPAIGPEAHLGDRAGAVHALLTEVDRGDERPRQAHLAP